MHNINLKWLYADELRKNYTVYGSFYNIINVDDSITKCRNTLEIYNKQGDFQETLQLKPFSYSPDAIFIMMNPGSSRPENKNCEPIEYEINKIKEMSFINCLVKAHPDVTQYQVMRVMEFKGWKHVRVINLSDIRESKSKVFYKMCKSISNKDNLHSIFSEKRHEELKAVFNVNVEVQLVLAWGINKELSELARSCFVQLDNNNIENRKVAIRPEGLSEIHCYHACPIIESKKKFWITEICSKL